MVHSFDAISPGLARACARVVAALRLLVVDLGHHACLGGGAGRWTVFESKGD